MSEAPTFPPGAHPGGYPGGAAGGNPSAGAVPRAGGPSPAPQGGGAGSAGPWPSPTPPPYLPPSSPPLPPSPPPSVPAGGWQAAPHAPFDAEPLRAHDGPFVPFVLRGHLLTIATLGIYRFWYKTALRNWYWSRTVAGGEPLDYTGTGRELFVGFLLALAVFVPLALVAGFAGLLLGETLGAVVTVAAYAAMAYLAQYAAYRARAYRLSRTVWRGLRFRLAGSAHAYAWRALGWAVLVLLSLGLAYPWMRASLEGFRMRNTFWGRAQGLFWARGSQLLPAWLVVIGPSLACVGLVLLALGGTLVEGVESFEMSRFATGLVVAIVVFVLVFLMSFVAWPYYRAREVAVFTGATALGPFRFASTLRGGDLYPPILLFVGLMIAGSFALSFVGGILAAIVAIALAGSFEAMDKLPGGAAAGIALILPFYLGFFLLKGVLGEAVLARGNWLRIVNATWVAGLSQADSVVAAGGEAPNALGEGLGDAIDIGAF